MNAESRSGHMLFSDSKVTQISLWRYRIMNMLVLAMALIYMRVSQIFVNYATLSC